MPQAIEGPDTAPRMLIADDDPAIVSLLADQFTKLGFQVETAANGIQALIMARRTPPDILIIDVHMPEADGLTVCARLLTSRGKPMDVIVVTGSADPETVERCESMGMFYGRKGIDFWRSMAAALVIVFPHMADKIKELEHRSPNAEARRRPRVLVIDDDPEVKEFLASRLGKCGVDMLQASNSIEGYRIACREKPTVIISDYFMPDGDALYLLSRLRSTPATESIPVFVWSGRRLDEQTEQILMREICGHRGATRIFKKSFDIQELFQALQEYCGFDKRATDGSSATNKALPTPRPVECTHMLAASSNRDVA